VISITVSRVRLRRANSLDQQSGLLGFLAFELGPLFLDGVALRRTEQGRLILVFPVRRGRDGIAHPLVLPIDPAARAGIQDAVLTALRAQGEPL
jgi:DNA-binding cell septation regulator SpoVG